MGRSLLGATANVLAQKTYGLIKREPPLKVFCTSSSYMNNKKQYNWNRLMTDFYAWRSPPQALMGSMLDSYVIHQATWCANIISYSLEANQKELAYQVHADAIKMGFEKNEDMLDTLLELYYFVGTVEDWKYIFVEISKLKMHTEFHVELVALDFFGSRGLYEDWLHVSLNSNNFRVWNMIFSTPLDEEFAYKKGVLFKILMEKGFPKPTEHILTYALSCGEYGVIKGVHVYATKVGLLTSRVINAIIRGYSECAFPQESFELFNTLKSSEKDTYVYNAILFTYANHGYYEWVFAEFKKLQEQGLKADEVTVLGVLTAYCRSGRISEGKLFFSTIKEKFGINPNMKHFTCFIDMIGKHGEFQEIEEFVSIAEKILGNNGNDFVDTDKLWRVVAQNCKLHDNFQLGVQALKKISEWEVADSILKAALNFAMCDYTLAENSHWDVHKSGQHKRAGKSRLL